MRAKYLQKQVLEHPDFLSQQFAFSFDDQHKLWIEKLVAQDNVAHLSSAKQIYQEFIVNFHINQKQLQFHSNTIIISYSNPNSSISQNTLNPELLLLFIESNQFLKFDIILFEIKFKYFINSLAQSNYVIPNQIIENQEKNSAKIKSQINQTEQSIKLHASVQKHANYHQVILKIDFDRSQIDLSVQNQIQKFNQKDLRRIQIENAQEEEIKMYFQRILKQQLNP